MTAVTCNTVVGNVPEVAERTLVVAIRANTNANDPFMNPAPIMTYLNAFPDSPARDLTRAALMQMWWIDCDWASAHGHVLMLDLLLNMALNRPLQYSKSALLAAIEQCHLDVVEWWYARARNYQAVATSCPLYIESWMSFGEREMKPHVLKAVQSGHPKAVAVVQWFVDRILNWQLSEPTAAVAERAKQLADLFPPAIEHGLWPILTELFGNDSDQQAAVVLAAHYGARMAFDCTHRESRGDDFCIGAVSSGHVVFARQVFFQFKMLDVCIPIADCAKVAFHNGNVEMIEWLVGQEGVVPDWEMLKESIQAGHVHIVHWYMARFEIAREHVGTLLDLGAKYGQIELLELGYMIDPECLVFSSQAPLLLQVATDQGHVHVLEWWQANNFPISQGQLGPYDFDVACKLERSVGVLDWWVHTSGLTCYKYSERAIFNATANGCVGVLEWWKSRSGLPLKVPRRFLLETRMPGASSFQHEPWQQGPSVAAAARTRWWMLSGLLPKDDFAVTMTVGPGQVLVLDFLLQSGVGADLESLFTLMRRARACNSVAMIDYLFKRIRVPLGTCAADLLNGAIAREAFGIVEWVIKEQTGPFPMTAGEQAMIEATILKAHGMLVVRGSGRKTHGLDDLLVRATEWAAKNLVVTS